MMKNKREKGDGNMICSVRTLGISGIQGSAVTAECYISQGLPGFDIVGLPDAAVKEARDRVRAAAKSSGLSFPVSRITVNLAPASQKKAGTHYDLPILLSILAASGSVRRPKSTSAFLGELSLDGTIRPISGVLPMALAAKREGIQALFVPAENAPEATLARGPAVYPIHTVAQLAAGLNGETTLEEEPLWVPSREDTVMPDFKDVLGQENVKRALEVQPQRAAHWPARLRQKYAQQAPALHSPGYDVGGIAGGQSGVFRRGNADAPESSRDPAAVPFAPSHGVQRRTCRGRLQPKAGRDFPRP